MMPICPLRRDPRVRRFCLWLYPGLRAELEELREANSRVVIENSRLHDEILVLTHVDRASIMRCERVDSALATRCTRLLHENFRLQNELEQKTKEERHA